MPDDYDDEIEHVYREVTGPDPGRAQGADEPELRALCRRCVRDLPVSGGVLCAFCEVIA